MTKKAKRKKKKSFRFGAFLIVFLLVFGSFKIGQVYLDYQKIKGEVDYYQDKLNGVQEDYAALQEEKGLLYNDSYLEKMARENLGMIKEGETLVLPMVEGDPLELNVDPNEDNNIH